MDFFLKSGARRGSGSTRPALHTGCATALPATLTTRTCAGGGGGRGRADRGGHASPSATRVACCFPDPSPPAGVAPPRSPSPLPQGWGVSYFHAPRFARCFSHPSWRCAASPPHPPPGERCGCRADAGAQAAPSAGTRAWWEVAQPAEEADVRGALSLLCLPACAKGRTRGWGIWTPFPLPSHSLCKGSRTACASRSHMTPAAKGV